MTNTVIPFAGRIIFHHQPKTAGQAINAWLSKQLGVGSVTPNLIGQHRELIQLFGGEYPVLSGHFDYDGSGLDPRYHYCTVLREPVDRFISWLYYVIHDVGTTEDTRELKEGAQLFLQTEGRESNEAFLESVRNLYVENFRKAVMLADAPAECKINAAYDVAQAYDLIGFYDELPQFVDNLAKLIGLKKATPLAPVNVTSHRLSIAQISPALRSAIEANTVLDREFYQQLWGQAQTRAKNKRKTQALIGSFSVVQRSWAFSTTPVRPSWAAGYLRQFEACSFSSQNGATDGSTYISNGNAGYLIYGAILDLDPGNYNAVIAGLFQTEGAMVVADVSYDRGLSVIASQSLCDYELAASNFSVSLSFGNQVVLPNLEFRLWVPSHHVVQCKFVCLIDEDALYAHRKFARDRFIDRINPGASDAISFEAAALFTSVGAKTKATLQTQGLAGVLSFGPYTPLARGTWWVVLVGLVGPQGLDGAWVDVSFSGGENLVHKEALSIPPFNDEALFIGKPWSFTLHQDVEDLEIRVFVGKRSQISLAQVILIPSPEGRQQPNLVEENTQDA